MSLFAAVGAAEQHREPVTSAFSVGYSDDPAAVSGRAQNITPQRQNERLRGVSGEEPTLFELQTETFF